MPLTGSAVRLTPAQTKLVICVWHPFTEWRPKPVFAETIRANYPEMRVVHLPNYDLLPQELPGTHIFVGAFLRPAQLAVADELQWIHSTAAGVSQLMYPELKNSGVILTNTSGISSVPIAEHTMGLILAMARNFPDSLRYQDQAKWSQQELWDKPQRISEINGSVLLIVGYGSIGRELARRARAFDMRVWGVTRSGKGDAANAEKMLPISQLNEALPHADYVVIAAPETPETKHLIGAKQIAQMKRGARLINVARGSLLDETALIDALQSGALGGAALDVTSKEPLPPESPLWHTPNLFITPHTSAISERLWERETELMMKLLYQWFSGNELSNRVDFSRGY
jgi:phosphoglycerate dehydrogenase-like enzyme